MIRVGVTGGIGSGKTTFCKVWKDLGAYVLYADAFAKQLMVTDHVIMSGLIDAFGEETYLKNKALNKPHLIREAFEKGRVDELNAIVHPRLRVRTLEEISRIEREGYPLFAYEAAILLNEGRPDYLDHIVLLLADKEVRVQRVVERDQTESELVLDRVQSQPKFEDLTHLVDHVIPNTGDLADLKMKAKDLYNRLIHV